MSQTLAPPAAQHAVGGAELSSSVSLHLGSGQRLHPGPRNHGRVMDTTAQRSSLRRVVRGAAAVVVTTAITLGFSATPANARPKHDSDCAVTARLIYDDNMWRARTFILGADRLAAAGERDLANQAMAEADYYLGEAKSAQNDLAAC
jgi:hypothetical protein